MKWCRELEQIPVNLEAYGELDVSKTPELKVFMEQMKSAVARPRIPDYETLESDIINPQMELVLKGKKDVDSMLASIQKEIEEKILSLINE